MPRQPRVGTLAWTACQPAAHPSAPRAHCAAIPGHASPPRIPSRWAVRPPCMCTDRQGHWLARCCSGASWRRPAGLASLPQRAQRTSMAHSEVGAARLPGTMGGGRPSGPSAAAARSPPCPNSWVVGPGDSTSRAARDSAEASSSARVPWPSSPGWVLRGRGRRASGGGGGRVWAGTQGAQVPGSPAPCEARRGRAPLPYRGLRTGGPPAQGASHVPAPPGAARRRILTPRH